MGTDGVTDPGVHMNFEVAPSESETGVLFVRGELDVAGVARLSTAGRKVLEAGATDVVLECTALEFTDSSGLGCLVALHKRAAERGGRLVLRNVNERFERLLAMVRLDQVFALERLAPVRSAAAQP